MTEAIVLAAGLGTRMQPITHTIPKPLVEVAGVTLLDHALNALGNFGATKTVVNVHYLADQIEDHLAAREGLSTIVSDEREGLLDSGGGVKKALDHLGSDPVVILNADSFWKDGDVSNLDAMSTFWNPTKMDVLLLLCKRDEAIGFDGKGDFFADNDGRLTRRGDALTAPLVYAGAIILKPELLRAVSETKFSLLQIFNQAREQGKLFGIPLNGLWLHVGDPEAIGLAETALENFGARR